MKNYILVFTVFLFFIKPCLSADTLRVMHYNLLYYDKSTSFCTSTNNNVDTKDGNLKEITGYFKPDIFTANEINGNPTSVQRILTNVFNTEGVDYYKRANYQGEYLVNMLYYNSNKLVLKSQSYVITSPRLTDVYRLYLKTNDLVNGDTILLTCFVAHLKAGNTSEDAAERATTVQQIMSYINNRNIQGNVLVMGDFNLYTSSEAAFQKFITTTATGFRFFDPANAMGNWQGNSDYANYHSQSTHTSSDCYSGGGMDDRFDFILTSLPILQSGELSYVDGSYWAFGQDGKRFNQPLTSDYNPNTSLPADIISALYSMSDHLPVVMKMTYSNESTSTQGNIFGLQNTRVGTYVSENIDIFYSGSSTERVSITIVSLIGTMVHKSDLVLTPGQKTHIPAGFLNPGIYLVILKGAQGKFVAKIVKN